MVIIEEIYDAEVTIRCRNFERIEQMPPWPSKKMVTVITPTEDLTSE